MKVPISMFLAAGLWICCSVGAAPPKLPRAAAAANDGKFFAGDWRVGQPGKPDFVISLREDHTAKTSLSKASGKWQCVNGEAQIHWSSGARNVIRHDGAGFRKLYWKAGSPLNGPPTDTSKAEKIARGK